MSVPSTIALGIQVLILFFHPLHVSVTEIEYDEKDRELEIILRIFTDDLEKAIQDAEGKPGMDMLNPPKDVTTDKLVSRYLSGRLKISLDGKIQPQRYLGYEEEGEALLCYVQVRDVKKWKTIEVTNSVLMEKYDDQSNIVHVTAGKKTKSMRLVPGNASGKLSFEDK